MVAYRQPTARSEIEAIRGVSCGEILRQLMDRDLVRVQGRSEELGRPYLYATTKRFLQVFGLNNLDKLPRADQMRQAAPAGQSQGQAISPGELAESSESNSTQEESEVTMTVELAPSDSRRYESTVPRSSTDDPEFDDDDSDDDTDDDDTDDDDTDDDGTDDDGTDDDGTDDDGTDDDDDDDDDDFDDFDDEFDEEDDDLDDEEDEWEEVEDDDDDDDEWGDDDEDDDDWGDEEDDEEADDKKANDAAKD